MVGQKRRAENEEEKEEELGREVVRRTKKSIRNGSDDGWITRED